MADRKPIINQRLSTLIDKYSSRDIVQKLEQQFKSLTKRDLNPLMIDDIPVLKEVTIRSDQLRDLLETLTGKPILNPLVVRYVNGRYQIVLGRKIWYATKLLKFQKVPVVLTTMSEEEMRDYLAVDSLKFISLDGLYRAVGEAQGRNAKCPQYCDACFSGEYPVAPSDMIEKGFQLKAAE